VRDPPDDPGNPTVNFHGEKRRNDTHISKTDPEAKLARKGNGKEAKLSFSVHTRPSRSRTARKNGVLRLRPRSSQFYVRHSRVGEKFRTFASLFVGSAA